MKFVRWNGSSYEEISGGGGGGSSHTHANLSVLNQITQALLNSWNTAATWVSTNGENVLSHLSDTVKHITSAERTAWNNKLSDAPSDGSQYARQNGAWTRVQGGGGGSFGGLVFRGSAAVKSTVSLVAECASTDTCIVYTMVSDSRRWSITVPLAELTSTATTYAIATGSNYRDFKLARVGNTVTMTRSSTTAFTFYAYSF